MKRFGKIPQRRLNIIDGSTISYCVNLNSLAWVYLIRQANDLVSVLADMENNRQIIKDTSKKRGFNREVERIQKSKLAKDVSYFYSGFPTWDSFERIYNDIPFVNSFPLFPFALSFEL